MEAISRLVGDYQARDMTRIFFFSERIPKMSLFQWIVLTIMILVIFGMIGLAFFGFVQGPGRILLTIMILGMIGLAFFCFVRPPAIQGGILSGVVGVTGLVYLILMEIGVLRSSQFIALVGVVAPLYYGIFIILRDDIKENRQDIRRISDRVTELEREQK